MRYSWLTGLLRWCSGKKSVWQFRRHKRHGFNPWVRKIPWRRKWQPTPVFLPGKSHGQRSLVGYSPWGQSESNMTEQQEWHSKGLISRTISWEWIPVHYRKRYKMVSFRIKHFGGSSISLTLIYHMSQQFHSLSLWKGKFKSQEYSIYNATKCKY